MPFSESWKYVLICLAAAVLAVGLKNYLVYLLYDTTLCTYLCPSIFGESLFEYPIPLQRLFDFQIWLEESAQEASQALWRGHITHVPSGKRRYVSDLGDVVTVIASYLEAMGVELDSVCTDGHSEPETAI